MLELDILHHRTRGHKQAKKALAAINSRWRRLDRLVNQYNQEVRRINSEMQELAEPELREISARDLRERGIECDEVWDADRMSSRSDWAKYHFVREGIDSGFLLKRVVEERERLQLHLRRMCRWVRRQSKVLFEILDPAASVTIPHDAVKVLLLHRDKVAANLLEIKHRELLSLESREELGGTYVIFFQLLTGLIFGMLVLRSRIRHILGPIPLSLSPDEPIDTSEEGFEEAGGGATEGVDDGLFALQGECFDEELAARIMLQDELGGGEENEEDQPEEVADI